MMVGRGAEEARACATSAPTPTPGRSGRPSTCCCGCSRCAPAATACSSASAQIGRPCLLGYIGKCSAPCVGRVTAEEHREIVDDFCDFMAGQTDGVRQAAREGDVRRVRRRRTTSGRPGCATTSARCNRAMEKQAVVLGDGTDADVVAFAEDPLEVAVQIFYVRGGRIRGQRGWVADKVDDADTGGLVERFLLQLYDGRARRRDPARGARAGAARRRRGPRASGSSDLRGGRVSIRVPQRGDKKALHGDRRPATPRRRSACTRPSGPAT